MIKKLHYEAGEMAKVGKPLVDIDIQGEVKGEEMEALTGGEESLGKVEEVPEVEEGKAGPDMAPPTEKETRPKGKHASLATPAVRHLTRELDVNIQDVNGTGRDGRVLKEDIYQFAKERDNNASSSSPTQTSTPSPSSSGGAQIETTTPLSNTQAQMFKTMTKSLTIPHFLYADELDFTGIAQLRSRLNTTLAKFPIDSVSKISYLPFVIKAVSLALDQYPILNARVDVDSSSSKPALVMRSQHNIGVAMDTPTGLLVPVIRNVASHSILSLASEITRLQGLASSGKLTSQDMSGGTITVSNIGNIGGTYVSPVIVEKEVAILGIGKIRSIPAFDAAGAVVKKEVCNFSWSADHRVVDGATMARAAEVVRGFVEEPESLVVRLR